MNGGHQAENGLTRSAAGVQLGAMTARTLTAAAVLALSVATASPFDLRAQEAEEAESWKADVGLSVTSSGGNENLTLIVTELGLTHLRSRQYELNLGTRLRYGRSEGQDVAQNVRGDISLDLFPEAGWSPFLFSTAETDPFKKLDARVNTGVGMKRTFWRREWDEVSLSGAVLHSYEDVDIAPADSVVGHGITRSARWSWRGRARRELSQGTRAEQVVFFQPAWNHIADYLLEAQSSVRVALTRSLAFTATFLFNRDSTPAEDVEPDDWSVAVGLSLATSW